MGNYRNNNHRKRLTDSLKRSPALYDCFAARFTKPGESTFAKPALSKTKRWACQTAEAIK